MVSLRRHIKRQVSVTKALMRAGSGGGGVGGAARGEWRGGGGL